MKVVSKEIGAVHSSVPIEYSKIGGFFPIVDMFWLCKIKYNCNSILIILSNWALVGGCRICPDSPTAIFGMLGRFKIGNGGHYFGNIGMLILISSNSPFLNIKSLGLYEYFLPYNLINLLSRWFRFRSWLVFITILYIWILGQLQSFIGIVK